VPGSLSALTKSVTHTNLINLQITIKLPIIPITQRTINKNAVALSNKTPRLIVLITLFRFLKLNKIIFKGPFSFSG